MLCSAQLKSEAADIKSEPSMQSLTVLRAVDLICHLWQQYVNTALLPLASSSVTIRREMVVFNNQSVSRLEGGANHLLQRVTDCMCRTCSPWKNRSLTTSLTSGCCVVVCTAHETKTERLQASE